MSCSPLDIRASSATAIRDWATPSGVTCAAVTTQPMFAAMSPDPVAASFSAIRRARTWPVRALAAESVR
ncbi:MAG: hypothetical protein JWR28_2353 [Modestobacter sp.]|nr:hypothetical protein [Modestobacter sp.]